MDKDEKKAPAAVAVAAVAAEPLLRPKRKFREENALSDDNDDDGPALNELALTVDYTEPRGNLRRSEGAVDSDSDLDDDADSPAALKCQRDMQDLLNIECIADLTKSVGSMLISKRSNLKPEKKQVSLLAATAAADAVPILLEIDAGLWERVSGARDRLRLEDGWIRIRTDKPLQARPPGPELTAPHIKIRFASETVVYPIPASRLPLPVVLFDQHVTTADWRDVAFGYIYSLPRKDREQAVRRFLRGIDKALFKRSALHFPRPLDDADDDPFSGFYLPKAVFEQRLGRREDCDAKAVDVDVEYHEGEDDEDYDEAATGEEDNPDLGSGDEDNYEVEEYDVDDWSWEHKHMPSDADEEEDDDGSGGVDNDNGLSAFDTPALRDSLHYLNARIMAQFVVPWARETGVDEKDQVTITLLLIRNDLHEIREQVLDGFISHDQLNDARAAAKAVKEAKDDPRLQGNKRMFEMGWLLGANPVEDSKAAALKALKRLKSAAQEVRTSNLLLQAVAQVTAGNLQDRLCRKLDGLCMVLNSAKDDLMRLRDLQAEVLCCELQLKFLNLTRKGNNRPFLDLEAYHPVLGTSRGRVLARLMGVQPDRVQKAMQDKLRQLLGADYVDDFTNDAKQLSGQSVAFVLALGNVQVRARYAEVHFSADQLCYFADSECVRIILQKKRERLAHINRLQFVDTSNRTIERMCSSLNLMHSTVSGAASAASASVWVQPDWITAAHGATDADILRRLSRLSRALDVMGAIKRSVETLFEAINARHSPTKCVDELQKRFSALLLDPPVMGILSGAADGAATPDLSVYALSGDSVARKWQIRQDEKERKAARAEAREGANASGCQESDDIYEAVHGDIVEAFPASFEVYHRRQLLQTKSDLSLRKLALMQAAQRDERAYKRVKRAVHSMPKPAAPAVAAAAVAAAAAASAEPEAMKVDG